MNEVQVFEESDLMTSSHGSYTWCSYCTLSVILYLILTDVKKSRASLMTNSRTTPWSKTKLNLEIFHFYCYSIPKLHSQVQFPPRGITWLLTRQNKITRANLDNNQDKCNNALVGRVSFKAEKIIQPSIDKRMNVICISAKNQ